MNLDDGALEDEGKEKFYAAEHVKSRRAGNGSEDYGQY